MQAARNVGFMYGNYTENVNIAGYTKIYCNITTYFYWEELSSVVSWELSVLLQPWPVAPCGNK